VALSPFPSAPPAALRALDVRVVRPAPDRLVLDYELQGDLSAVRLGSGGDRDRPTDGLWRHTCMEVFVAREPAGAYLEFNLAPSGEWAAYRFSGYRAGMAPLTGIHPPRIELRTQSDRQLLSAEVQLPWGPATGPLRLGLAAVIESTPGPLSYWALRHPAERPDFHHPDSFGFEI
jgi:hypothetical protein